MCKMAASRWRGNIITRERRGCRGWDGAVILLLKLLILTVGDGA